MELARLKNGTPVDLNYARKVVEQNQKEVSDRRGDTKVIFFKGLTTSKLRNLLELVNHIYTKVYNDPSKELSEDIRDELEYLKVKFAYEAGREPAVREFIDKTYVKLLLDRVLKKNTKKFFLDYCKYFEALVAYAKFYKMED
ncbi:type III-A CRISPR-associated protein Csm2 [Enterococcus xiangfangensis]|uniref:CRISPR system Cms protein Csm2 n=1 Tax=Enterococcus xiangfangensis TaxID=1296537 RepID=A0ABU3FDP9_9ENTE|nr:type III-A CRISPR-associated protein Csm2 [Enterococcus xiangfangensis]MDT2760808.1 type III-A CRISPR-associated protein Csm2 [Enterococcus xiangfangensis]